MRTGNVPRMPLDCEYIIIDAIAVTFLLSTSTPKQEFGS